MQQLLLGWAQPWLLAEDNVLNKVHTKHGPGAGKTSSGMESRIRALLSIPDGKKIKKPGANFLLYGGEKWCLALVGACARVGGCLGGCEPGLAEICAT